TGVQTCALPIYEKHLTALPPLTRRHTEYLFKAAVKLIRILKTNVAGDGRDFFIRLVEQEPAGVGEAYVAHKLGGVHPGKRFQFAVKLRFADKKLMRQFRRPPLPAEVLFE